MADRLNDMPDWWANADQVTAEGMMTYTGIEAMTVDAAKDWTLNQTRPAEDTAHTFRLHHLAIFGIINATGFIAALQVLQDLDPDTADRVAREHWAMCDAGNTIEVLWPMLESLGIDVKKVRDAVPGGWQ